MENNGTDEDATFQKSWDLTKTDNLTLITIKILKK